MREVYRERRAGGRGVDAGFLLRRLGPLGAPLGQDWTDGGQHDCEEVLSAMMDRLHEDLVRPRPIPPLAHTHIPQHLHVSALS